MREERLNLIAESRPVAASPEAKSFWIPLVLALMAGFMAALIGSYTGSAFKLLVLGIGAISLIVMFFKIELGIYFLAFSILTNLSDIATEYHGAPPTTKYLVIGLLLFIFMRNFLSPGTQRFPTTPLVVFVGMALLLFASLFHADSYYFAFEELSDFIKAGVVLLIVTAVVTSRAHLRNVIWMLILAGLFLGSISCIQFITGNYADFGGFGQTTLGHISGEVNSLRLTGPYTDANVFAQIILVALPLAFNRFLHERSLILRLVAAATLVAVTLAVILTYSRGALVALIVVALAYLVRSPVKLKTYAVIACVGLSAWFYLPDSYYSRLQNATHVLLDGQESVQIGEPDSATQGRVSEMIAAAKMFVDHPILGVGAGNYVHHFQAYTLGHNLKPRHESRMTHNLYLEIAAELGLVGLTAYGILFFLIFRNVRSACRWFESVGKHETSNLVFALGLGLLGYFAAGIFLHAVHIKFMWLLIGLGLALPQIIKTDQRLEKGPGNLHEV